jgi:hypothetical protein
MPALNLKKDHMSVIAIVLQSHFGNSKRSKVKRMSDAPCWALFISVRLMCYLQHGVGISAVSQAQKFDHQGLSLAKVVARSDEALYESKRAT